MLPPAGWPRALKHGAPAAGASFAPDGARIVTISDDRNVRIWDASTGLPLALPIPSEAPIVNAAFTADGARIVVADGHAVRTWDVALDTRPPEEWATVANQSPYILKDGVLTASSARTRCGAVGPSSPALAAVAAGAAVIAH